MNRIFGRGKPKEPGPSITDCISNVSVLEIASNCLIDDSLDDS